MSIVRGSVGQTNFRTSDVDAAGRYALSMKVDVDDAEGIFGKNNTLLFLQLDDGAKGTSHCFLNGYYVTGAHYCAQNQYILATIIIANDL